MKEKDLERLLAIIECDRTRHPRVERDLYVDCIVEDGRKISGTVKNISVKGLRARFEEHLSPNTLLLLRIWFPDSPESGEEAQYVDSYAEIVWCVSEDTPEYGMAFITMDRASYDRVAGFVDSHKMDDVVADEHALRRAA